MKLACLNLGCPKNQLDLETILGGLSQNATIIDDPLCADAVIINTCAFIDSAKQESIDAIFEIASLKEENQNLKVLVTGCLPQRYQQQLIKLMPEVDRFFFTVPAMATLRDVEAYLQQPPSREPKRHPLSPGHYAYLRIAEGCSNRCAYCAIPLIKGAFYSRPLELIVDEAQQLVRSGVKEIMLIGQDTTLYGSDLSDGVSLEDVLVALNDINGLAWIRLLYTHPAHWRDSLIDTMASLPKVVRYVDLPIQHIADAILERMGRKIRRAGIEKLIEKIRCKMPDIALRTSIITGFPGESEENFAELLDFLQQVQFERLGVFTYSHEENTRAYKLKDDVSQEVKLERQRTIMQLQEEIVEKRNVSLLGQQMTVIVDEPDEKQVAAYARSQWDAPEIDGNILLSGRVVKGEFYSARITDSSGYDLIGEVVQSSRPHGTKIER
ncbi:30S ribosomal protein S12 methylthiotransferase RimO [candidate division KSB1 bacterium]|nr:30S ribosomal protein S12 methylthiotransferase RimO [candidate division KSB1 bacterium]RQW10785.1 MAG: 30S ribosomal protein S12 methylthiotransferase RimO [candidate division KSB1 bacterium]